MTKSLRAACVCVVMLHLVHGCTAMPHDGTAVSDEATTPPPLIDAAHGELTPDGTPYQYRAVCMEKEAHGGTEYVLTRWLDSKDKAAGYGAYHGEFKYNGHRWRIEQRIRPERPTP